MIVPASPDHLAAQGISMRVVSSAEAHNSTSPKWSARPGGCVSCRYDRQMKIPRRALAASLAVASVVALSGCSINVLLWGPDGGSVIDKTEQLIAAAPSGGQNSLACPGSAPDFGDASVWEGLAAGEPEQFDPATSVDRPRLDAGWRINLEGVGIDETSGREIPTDVFYRKTETSLCVADVIWQSLDFG